MIQTPFFLVSFFFELLCWWFRLTFSIVAGQGSNTDDVLTADNKALYTAALDVAFIHYLPLVTPLTGFADQTQVEFFCSKNHVFRRLHFVFFKTTVLVIPIRWCRPTCIWIGNT